MARYILNDTVIPVDSRESSGDYWKVSVSFFLGGTQGGDIQCASPPKCDGCQTLLAIQHEQHHRVETALSSPPSSADDGLDAGREFIRKPRDSNVTNLVLSLFIMIMICMVSNICDTSIAQGLLSKTAALANRCSMPSEPVPMDRHTYGRIIDCDAKPEHDLIGASEAKEYHLRTSRGSDGGRSHQGLQLHGHGNGVHT